MLEDSVEVFLFRNKVFENIFEVYLIDYEILLIFFDVFLFLMKVFFVECDFNVEFDRFFCFYFKIVEIVF